MPFLRYMSRTKQHRTYLPYTFLAVAGTHLLTPKGRMEGWVSPGPGCKEQLAHGCYATARSQRDSNPRPCGRWSNTLTTRLSQLHWPRSTHYNRIKQPESIITLWPLPHYTARWLWQKLDRVTNLPRVITSQCTVMAWSWTRNHSVMTMTS